VVTVVPAAIVAPVVIAKIVARAATAKKPPRLLNKEI
jgi:hypothetical protein